MAFPELLRRPSAYVPIVMSIAALALVLLAVMFLDAAHQTDEGFAAHLWQLLVAGQLPVIVFCAAKWLPRSTRPALCVLAAQAFALLIAIAPVYLLRL